MSLNPLDDVFDSAATFDEEDDVEELERKRRFIYRVKIILLYFIFPPFMMASSAFILYAEEVNAGNWKIVFSRTLLNLTSILTGIILAYSLIKLIWIRWNDYITEGKVKFMWGFIAFTVIFRVLYFFLQAILAA